jgi:hypothetical protein
MESGTAQMEIGLRLEGHGDVEYALFIPGGTYDMEP